MPTPTYVPLATETLSATDTSVTFSSIPATYRDLVLVVAGNGEGFVYGRFNGDAGAKYSRVIMQGKTDNTTQSVASSGLTFIDSSWQITNNANAIFQMLDYSATDKHKTVLLRWNSPVIPNNGPVGAGAYRYADNSPITSFEIFTQFGSGFGTGATLSLYGIN